MKLVIRHAWVLVDSFGSAAMHFIMTLWLSQISHTLSWQHSEVDMERFGYQPFQAMSQVIRSLLITWIMFDKCVNLLMFGFFWESAELTMWSHQFLTQPCSDGKNASLFFSLTLGCPNGVHIRYSIPCPLWLLVPKWRNFQRHDGHTGLCCHWIALHGLFHFSMNDAAHFFFSGEWPSTNNFLLAPKNPWDLVLLHLILMKFHRSLLLLPHQC